MPIVLAVALGLAVGWLIRPLIDRETDPEARPDGGPRLADRLLTSVAVAFLFAASVWRFGVAWELLAYLAFATLSVALAQIDLRTHRLPNAMTLPALPALLGLLAVAALADDAWASLGRAAMGGPALLAVFAVLHLVNPSGMGLGDVKLSASMGLMLGWISWSALLTGTVIAFLLGAIVGLALMAIGRATRKSALPFGPFMLAGAWLAIVLSEISG